MVGRCCNSIRGAPAGALAIEREDNGDMMVLRKIRFIVNYVYCELFGNTARYSEPGNGNDEPEIHGDDEDTMEILKDNEDLGVIPDGASQPVIAALDMVPFLRSPDRPAGDGGLGHGADPQKHQQTH